MHFTINITHIIISLLYDSCPSKLQHSAENLAVTEGKFEGKSLLYVNKGKIGGVGRRG